jgi:uncharacterized integral membrane protein
MTRFQILGIGSVIITLGSLYLMFSNNFNFNNVLMFIGSAMLTTNFLIKSYKLKR